MPLIAREASSWFRLEGIAENRQLDSEMEKSIRH